MGDCGVQPGGTVGVCVLTITISGTKGFGVPNNPDNVGDTGGIVTLGAVGTVVGCAVFEGVGVDPLLEGLLGG